MISSQGGITEKCFIYMEKHQKRKLENNGLFYCGGNGTICN